MGLPSAIGDFSELFHQDGRMILNSGFMRREVMLKMHWSMKPYEKQISFLNKYFVFKKVRDVNAKDVATSIIDRLYSSR